MIQLFTLLQKSFLTFGAGVNDVFGSPVKPPGPSFTNPVEGISRVIITGIRLSFIVAAILVLLYLLWGAIDWIVSAGEQEKLEKARLKMTHAVLGIVILVAALVLFTVVTGDITQIIRKDSDGNWRFELPTIQTK